MDCSDLVFLSQCTDFVADFEDDIVDMFAVKEKTIEYKLCYQLAGMILIPCYQNLCFFAL